MRPDPPPEARPPTDRLRRPRLTIGAVLILVALIAVGLAVTRPRHTRVIEQKIGTGPAVKPGDTVSVHYVGRLADGTEIDSSRGRGIPFEFDVGRGSVIEGWEVGLVGMRAGGIRRLIIPPTEAYGEQGAGPIPPNATLTFEVELLGIKRARGR